MSGRPALRGCIRHFLLTIHLNFRNPQAMVYGYLVPILFLFAFGSIFRSDTPLLLPRMGSLLTITILGGACFGLPTALVAEREQGIWKRYRLLPVPTAWLLLGTMAARVLLVASSVLVQIALARAIFGTPLPDRPGAAAAAFGLVTAAFVGVGFLIAALADSVPAVQALGQCLFLPMILIGGVGVPLSVLPVWAQRVAGFLPGRYAVELLQPCFQTPAGPQSAGFRAAALAAIGLAAGVAGAALFRWEPGRRPGPAKWWVGGALAVWAAVGALAWGTGRLQPVLPEETAWSNITEAEIAEIRFDTLPGDRDLAAPLAPNSRTAEQSALADRLAVWAPARLDDPGQSIRNLVALAAVADLCADPREAEIARAVLGRIKGAFDPAVARQALAWVILSPEDGRVVTRAPELGLFRHPPERLIRQRSAIYASKFLGRLLGKISD
jgi:ABC-2 type transport system permease protein